MTKTVALVDRIILYGRDPRAVLPPDCYFWIVEQDYSLEDYLDRLRDWLTRNTYKLARLLLVSHGNSGKLFIGTGVTLPIAGMFKKLRGFFDDRPGARRVVEIHGCGVASDTMVDVRTMRKDPSRQGGSFVINGVPHRIVTSNPRFDVDLTDGTRNVNVPGDGYRLLKAIADCTQAYVVAPINLESNVGHESTEYHGPILWVYPDDQATEDKYGLKPHGDNTVVNNP